MTIASTSYNEAGTFNSPTGGTNISFELTGEKVTNGIVLANLAESVYENREKLILTARTPVLGTDGSYSKLKVKCQVMRPFRDGQDKLHFNLCRVEFEVHPEAGSTETENLKSIITSILNDASSDNFFNGGALA